MKATAKHNVLFLKKGTVIHDPVIINNNVQVQSEDGTTIGFSVDHFDIEENKIQMAYSILPTEIHTCEPNKVYQIDHIYITPSEYPIVQQDIQQRAEQLNANPVIWQTDNIQYSFIAFDTLDEDVEGMI